jgi:hypothetical protein
MDADRAVPGCSSTGTSRRGSRSRASHVCRGHIRRRDTGALVLGEDQGSGVPGRAQQGLGVNGLDAVQVDDA